MSQLSPERDAPSANHITTADVRSRRVNAWFKHLNDFRNTPANVELIERYGMAGFGVHCALCEIVAAHIDQESAAVRYPLKFWLHELHTKRGKLFEILELLSEMGRISYELDRNYLRIEYPELFDRRDEYSRKRERKARKTTRHRSGECPDNDPDNDTDTSRKRRREKQKIREDSASLSSIEKQAPALGTAGAARRGTAVPGAGAEIHSIRLPQLPSSLVRELPDDPDDDVFCERLEAALLGDFVARFGEEDAKRLDELRSLRVEQMSPDLTHLSAGDREMFRRHRLFFKDDEICCPCGYPVDECLCISAACPGANRGYSPV
jgi:hypothetical protein